MVHRVVLGKAASNTTNPYYHRSNDFGLFVSKPGANVHNCADGDLIFDSTLPSLMQPIGRGSANIPKAVYIKGFFGEEGVINDDNWNSAGSGPEELNSDTSWAFGALKKVFSEVEEMKNNTFGEMSSRIAWPGSGVSSEQNINMESDTFTNLVQFSNHYQQYDPFKKTFKNFPDFSSDEFIRTMIKDIWRIYEVFPFLNDGHRFGDDFNPAIIDTSNWETLVHENSLEYVPPEGVSFLNTSPLVYDPTSFYPALFDTVNLLKPLDSVKLSEYVGNDITSNDNFPFYYPHWKGLFNSENLNGTVYNKIGYSSQNPIPNNFPMVWRAWTTPESGPYSVEQELAAIHKFYTYMFIFGWMRHTFANQVHSGILDYTLLNYASPGNYIFVFGNASDTDYINLLSITTLCPSAKTSFEQYDSYNNSIGYSKWSSGSVEVNTGITPPSNVPVQVWWNSILKGTSNTTTNLPFLNDSRNRIKTPEETKRKYSLVPGISSIHANTYIEGGLVNIRFSQPSTLDESKIFYTVYKEPAWISDQVSGSDISPNSPDIPQFSEYIILDVRDQSDGGDNVAGRKSEDGRYYTIVFPDDFIGTRNTVTDPFASYRDFSGRIDQALFITLSVAEGVVISGNSYFNHITTDELGVGIQRAGDAPFGPQDSAGRTTTEIFAANDPCIKLNLHSNEFTDDGLAGLTVLIENRGTIIGAGGWGSYGQMNMSNDKYQQSYPGGGGGGGQGYHPALQTESQTDWLGTYTEPPTAIVAPINTPEEITSVTSAVSNHWGGPDNYVEWGIGGNGGSVVAKYVNGNLIFENSPFSANTYYTGFDYISWKSIGPGKPGTGYLGATADAIATQPTGSPLYDYPYGKDPLVPDGNGRLQGNENIYERLAGTYNVFTGSEERPRYSADGWGENGFPGTTSEPGSGGAEKIVTTFGYSQDPILKISYDDPDDDLPNVNLGYPSSGSGGSCVYLYSNTESQIVGTNVRLVNMPTGLMKSGGGGGSGGSATGGLGGGRLGRPGKYSSDVVIDTSYSANSSEVDWNNYSRRGEPGKLVWWNSPNITRNYAIENNSTRTDGAIEGIDYNPVIGGEDYVSYAPNVATTGRRVEATLEEMQAELQNNTITVDNITDTLIADSTLILYRPDGPVTSPGSPVLYVPGMTNADYAINDVLELSGFSDGSVQRVTVTAASSQVGASPNNRTIITIDSKLTLSVSSQGGVYWSRTLDQDGNILYDDILERTYEEYINSSDTPEDFT